MTNDVKKGFNTTVGIVLALCVVFIVLPIGTCAGCMILGTAATAGSAAGVQASPGQGAGADKGDDGGIEISNVVMRMLSDNQFMHEATYKFDVTNSKGVPVTTSFNVKFRDADGLPLSEDYVRRQRFGAGTTTTITGKGAMSPEKGEQVVSILVEER